MKTIFALLLFVAVSASAQTMEFGLSEYERGHATDHVTVPAKWVLTQAPVGIEGLYEVGPCFLNLMTNSYLVVATSPDFITETLWVIPGTSWHFWTYRGEVPNRVSTSGPGIIDGCPFEALPTAVQERLRL